MLIKTENIAKFGEFVLDNRVIKYLEDVLFKNPCARIEDLNLLTSNTMLAIDNMLNGYSKKQYKNFEDFKSDLHDLKSNIDQKSNQLIELAERESFNCKRIVHADEFNEITLSLNDFAKDIILFQCDAFYDIYN